MKATTAEDRAGELAVLLNKLAWPEILGPYFPQGRAPHVVRGEHYTVTISHSTAMFFNRDTSDYKFVSLPSDVEIDVVAWLAVQFCDWVVDEARRGLCIGNRPEDKSGAAGLPPATITCTPEFIAEVMGYFNISDEDWDATPEKVKLIFCRLYDDEDWDEDNV